MANALGIIDGSCVPSITEKVVRGMLMLPAYAGPENGSSCMADLHSLHLAAAE